jgi:hypothetical protein
VARALSVSRVRVRPGAEAEYLAAARELAGLAGQRGWHLWVFRRPAEPGWYLEFSESRSPETHRSVTPRPEDERRLEERMRAAADYEPGAWDLWEEVG